jgi:hypothetical protein
VAVADAPRTISGYMSDYLAFGAAYADTTETVPDLIWPMSIQTYSKMRTDPQLTAVLAAFTYPMRSGTYAVDPAGCRDEVVALVADDMGLPVLGISAPPGPARRRGVKWSPHLRMALLMNVWGHMPFAQAYEIRQGRARLTDLAERMPSTITEIDTDDNGKLKGILQFGGDRLIPASSLVWYVREREGAAWQGRSMLRPAYGAWLLKHEMWRVLATSSRRFGAGVPTVHPPQGATPAEVADAARLAQSIRVGDQGGVGLPYGYAYELTGLSGSVPDTLGFVRYLDAQMAQSVLASVLNLDASPNGSRALGETLVGLLEMAWQAAAEEITDPATGLAVQMVDYNFGEDEPAPRIVATDINRPETTVQAITDLIRVGAIVPDAPLEAWLRARYKLPDKVAEVVEQGQRAGATGQPLSPTDLAQMIQKIYLGVGVVITAQEARDLLNEAGANLPADVNPAPPTPAAPPPPAAPPVSPQQVPTEVPVP